jgi:hypothetical protein
VKKNLLLLIASLAVCAVILEVLAYPLRPLLFGETLTKAQLQDRITRGIEQNTGDRTAQERYPRHISSKVIHPYLGFVGDPEYGMEFSSIRRSDDKVLVGVFGGSFAGGVYDDAREVLLDSLGRIPSFSGKKIELLRFSTEGYKQPQQLMALNTLLVLGGELDLLINIDGFNEIALPYAENYSYGVASYYPRQWRLYAQKSLDVEASMIIGLIALNNRERMQLRRHFATPPFIQSMFCLTVWNLLDRQKEGIWRELEDELNSYLMARGETPPQVAGPYVKYDNPDDFFGRLAEIWKNSSMQMANLCNENKIMYFHFLQPNQYVVASKNFSREEREKYIVPDNYPYSYRDAVRLGYKYLHVKGQELRSNDVNYADLTRLFKNRDETLYKDPCCHLNKRGYGLVAEEIARYVSEKL